MSKSPKDYEVGYKRPPVGRPFEPGNRAASRSRRRRAPGKEEMVEGLRDALQQEGPVHLKGTKQKVRLSYAIGHQIGQQLAHAPLPLKIKAWADLKKHGLLDLFDGENQLDEERAEFRAEKRDFAILQRSYQALIDLLKAEAESDRYNLRVAFEMLSAIKEQNACVPFEGEFLQTYEQLSEMVISRDEALAMAAAAREQLNAGEPWPDSDSGAAADLSTGRLAPMVRRRLAAGASPAVVTFLRD